MQKLILADGTEIEILERVNPSTFKCKASQNLYFELNEENLSFATLIEDEELEEVFLDCIRQNYFLDGDIVTFRIREKGGEK